jgi:hypothetical protein
MAGNPPLQAGECSNGEDELQTTTVDKRLTINRLDSGWDKLFHPSDTGFDFRKESRFNSL